MNGNVKLNDSVRVDGVINPFDPANSRTHNVFMSGMTLYEMLVESGFDPENQTLSVQLNQDLVNPNYWKNIRPKPGTQVVVRSVPQGGGDDSNKIFRTLGTIAVVALTGGLGGPGIGGHIFGQAVGGVAAPLTNLALGMAGVLAIRAIFPPPKPERTSGTTGRDGPQPFITGTQNEINKFGVVPRVFGKHKMFPLLGAQPTTLVRGDDQFLRQLFVLGYGPLDISDIKIGNTDINEFDEVTMEIREGRETDQPITLIPDSITEEGVDVRLDTDWTVRTTEPDTDEISVDIMFPEGLARFRDDGGRESRTVTVEVEYSPTGENDWSSPGNFNVTDNFTSRFLRGMEWDVQEGQYDVRLRRSSQESDDDQVLDRVDWHILRSIDDEPPIDTDENFAMIALKIKATDQISGVVDRLNCIVEAEIPDWDADTETWVERKTSNPASVFRHILQGSANSEALDDAQTNLESLEEWHEFCEGAIRDTADIVTTDATDDQFVVEGDITDFLENGDEFEVVDNSDNNDGFYTVDGSPSFDSGSNQTTINVEENVEDDNEEDGSIWFGIDDFEYNSIIDFEDTVHELLQEVASVGRASIDDTGGKIGVIIDEKRKSVIQHFTPRNSRNFEATKSFTSQPDAIRSSFVNREEEWEQDEFVVLDDGVASLSSAENVERMEWPGVTNPDHVWALTRYMLGQNKLRPEDFVIETDIEHIIATRGDMVRVSHDVPLIGSNWGRVTELITDNDGNITHVRVDEELEKPSGEDLVARFRLNDGTSLLKDVI